jgi:branched-chain amino acid transport system permease protein
MIGKFRFMNTRPAFEIAAALVLFAVPLGGDWLFNTYYLDLAARIVIIWIALLGYDILAGYTGLVSFGHAMFFGLGAYGAAWTLLYGPPSLWLALSAGTIAATAAAVIVGYLSINTKGVYFILLTLIFSQFGYDTIFNGGSVTGGQNGLSSLPKPVLNLPVIGVVDWNDPACAYYLVVVAFIAAYAIARLVVGSAFGSVLAAIRDNEERTAYLGYDVAAAKRGAFAVSGAFAGFAGALWAHHQSYVSPELLHWTLSGQFLIMTWLGGVGTLLGPLVGGAVLIYVADVLSSVMKNSLIVFGVLYILVVLYAPQGLWGLVTSAAAARRAR